MTFETVEKTLQLGAPIELYRFSRGNVRWHYTSADTDQVYDGSTWTAIAMARTAMEANAGEMRSALKITLPRDNPVVDMYRVSPPSDVISIVVLRFHLGDNDPRTVWSGRVLNVEWRGVTASMSCEPASVSMNRNGLRRLYSRQCPHRLYGPACSVTRASYDVPAVVDAVSGATITCSEFAALPTGYLSGGIFEWENGLHTERRAILSHAAGGQITITHIISGIPVGANVIAAPGCDHTTGANGCGRFNNLVNFGGFPYIPTKNPHGGSPIY